MYERALKQLVWIYESANLDVEAKIQEVSKAGFNLMAKWILPDAEPENISNCRGFVYVYTNTAQAKERMQQAVNFVKKQASKCPLIIFTRRRIEDDVVAIAEQLGEAKFATKLISTLEAEITKNQ